MGDRMPLPVGPEERGRRRSWRRSAGASALAIVILVAVGLGVLVARGLLDDEADTPSGGGPWEQLPRPPANDVLRGPELGSAVWTGRELILLASFAYAPPPSQRPPDGLAYNPATGRWRALPDPPPDQSIGGGRVGTVWTGKEVILLYATGTPIAYDPDANTWRRSARPPTGFISHAADPAPIWTGAEVLVWDGSNIDDTSGKRIDGGRGAAYNPATDRWRQLPRSPLSNRTWAIQAWTGQLLLVIAGSCGDAGQIRCLDGAAYDPAANTWTPIPALAGGGDRARGGGRLDRQRAGHLVRHHQQGRAAHPQRRQGLQPAHQAVAHAPTRPHRSAPTGRGRLGRRSAAGLGRDPEHPRRQARLP